MKAQLVEMLNAELDVLAAKTEHIKALLDDLDPVHPSPEEEVSQAQFVRDVIERHPNGATIEHIKEAVHAKQMPISSNYLYAVLRRDAKKRKERYFPAEK